MANMLIEVLVIRGLLARVAVFGEDIIAFNPYSEFDGCLSGEAPDTGFFGRPVHWRTNQRERFGHSLAPGLVSIELQFDARRSDGEEWIMQ